MKALPRLCKAYPTFHFDPNPPGAAQDLTTDAALTNLAFVMLTLSFNIQT
jgi:hypothetical protein